MAHELPDLPWSKDALSPHISAETLEFHHGKHHATYVKNLNNLVGDTPLADVPVEEVIRRIDEVDASQRTGVFNNAAQHFNHSFYWKGLRPEGGDGPTGSLKEAIDSTFGSHDEFVQLFTKESTTHFGSGWGWLVKESDGGIKVVSTHDAGTPLTEGQTPLLTCDVWEHAYYIDYRNARPKYLESFWKLVNWEFVQANFEG